MAESPRSQLIEMGAKAIHERGCRRRNTVSWKYCVSIVNHREDVRAVLDAFDSVGQLVVVAYDPPVEEK